MECSTENYGTISFGLFWLFSEAGLMYPGWPPSHCAATGDFELLALCHDLLTGKHQMPSLWSWGSNAGSLLPSQLVVHVAVVVNDRNLTVPALP